MNNYANMDQYNQDEASDQVQQESPADQSGNQQPMWKRILHKIDIFAFLPVPRTDPVSTNRSLCGSFILFALFFSYLIYSFIQFITNNVPRVNQTNKVLDAGNYTSPEMAIAFFWGEPFSKTINDPNILTITMDEVVKYQDVSKDDVKTKIPLISCTPDWIPSMGFPMLCPTNSTKMSGLLYATERFIYPRFSVTICVGKPECISNQDLWTITSGGRLILYIKNDSPDRDFVTGKVTDKVDYQTYQFFLNPGLYNRGEIIIQKQTYRQTPTYLYSFFDHVETYFKVQNEIFYLTNTTIFDNGSHGFQIWVRLAEEELQVDVVYQTITDVISQWGAFWGVLFAAFAIYFLRFNETRFYKKNPDWQVLVINYIIRNKFDQKLNKITPGDEGVQIVVDEDK